MNDSRLVRDARRRLKRGEALATILAEYKRFGVRPHVLDAIAERIVEPDAEARKKPRPAGATYWALGLGALLLLAGVTAALLLSSQAEQRRWDALRGPTFAEPVQGLLTDEHPRAWRIHRTTITFTVYPVAAYDADVVVLDRKRHYDDPLTPLSTHSLVLAWGRYADPGYLEERDVAFAWIGRELETSCGPGPCEEPATYANTHVIAENEAVNEGFARLAPPVAARLTGYLADVRVERGTRRLDFPTGTNLTDGAEILVVQRLTVGDETYG